jgi:hypothetical protein
MANNVTNYLKIIANDDATNRIDEMFDMAGGYTETFKLSQAFFGEEAKDSNEWYLDNLGAKWVYVENNIDMGEWNIQSANYTPKEFFIHLYKLITEIDHEGYLEVRYEDESLDPVGALVIKKGPNGVCFNSEEDSDMKNPTEDMEWDDEGYDEAQMNFTDEKFEAMDDMVTMCHSMIDSGKAEVLFKSQIN